MSKIKKIPYKFVHVYWIDITSDSAWRSIEDVKEESLPRCLSTGFLISDEEEVIRLVSDFNFKEDGSIDECGNSTIIPKCVVQEVNRCICRYRPTYKKTIIRNTKYLKKYLKERRTFTKITYYTQLSQDLEDNLTETQRKKLRKQMLNYPKV